MGAWSEFVCGSCGYEVMVSGRDDAGMLVNTTTVLCEDCEELHDVVTFRRAGMPGEEEAHLGPVEPKCPQSGGHTIRRWKHPDTCPKCGNMMVRGEKGALWD